MRTRLATHGQGFDETEGTLISPECQTRGYSWRKAAIGWTCEARRAETKAAVGATATKTPTPMSIAACTGESLGATRLTNKGAAQRESTSPAGAGEQQALSQELPH